MVSERVLEEMGEAGLQYIVGVRMRGSKVVQEVLSRAGRCSTTTESFRARKFCMMLPVRSLL